MWDFRLSLFSCGPQEAPWEMEEAQPALPEQLPCARSRPDCWPFRWRSRLWELRHRGLWAHPIQARRFSQPGAGPSVVTKATPE